jgi:IS4 transposase
LGTIKQTALAPGRTLTIKGHLRIRSFVGTTENAVRIQIWTALITYLLVAILKKILKLKPSRHEIP